MPHQELIDFGFVASPMSRGVIKRYIKIINNNIKIIADAIDQNADIDDEYKKKISFLLYVENDTFSHKIQLEHITSVSFLKNFLQGLALV